jgi:signal peptidase II
MNAPSPSIPEPSRPRQTGKLFVWLAVALVVIALDQLSKLYINASFQFAERVNVLPVFDLTLMYNRGAAFSFLASEPGWQRWFFSLLGIGASVVIVFLLRRDPTKRRFSLALALIMGGALGNVIDRIAYGHVIDFLLFYWNDAYYPAFNLADSAITCGAVLLVVDELIRARKPTLK